MLGLTRSRDRLGTALAALGLLATGVVVQATATATSAHAATPHRVLFDNAHAETVGNADWIIIFTSQPDPLGQDSSPSAETDWTGALSAWGVALQKTGDYSLKTLPSGSSLAYGGSATTDLSNFDTLVLPEPNTLFTRPRRPPS